MNIEKHTQIKKFIATRQIFTLQEFCDFLDQIGTTNKDTQKKILRNQIKAKRALNIRRGLYLSIGDAFDPDSTPVDPYLIAGKAARDAVVAYHSALEYHGLAYAIFFQSTFLLSQ